MYRYIKTQLMLWLTRKITAHAKCWKFWVTSQISTRDVYVRDNYCQKLKFLKKVMIGCWLPLKKNKQRPLDSLFLSEHTFFLSSKYIEQVKQQVELEFNCKCFFEVQMKQHSLFKIWKRDSLSPLTTFCSHRLYSYVQRRLLMFHNH